MDELEYLNLTDEERQLAQIMLDDGIDVEEVESLIIDDRYITNNYSIKGIFTGRRG